MVILKDKFIFIVNNGKVVKRRCFTELPTPDSIKQRIEAAATNENMDRGIELYLHDLQPFEVDGDEVWHLESRSYGDNPAKLPGVSMEANVSATPIHDELDLLDSIPEAAIAAADNAGSEDPPLASADPGVVVTDAEFDDKDRMDDEKDAASSNMNHEKSFFLRIAE